MPLAYNRIPFLVWLLLALALVAAFTACQSAPSPVPQQNQFYKRDMVIEINGVQSVGAMVVPRASKYAMDIQAKGKLDLFTFQTCHREDTRENAGKSGLFGDKKRIELNYTPVAGLEDIGSCVVRLGGYEQNGGRHSWAIIDFEDPKTTLPAVMKCNGESKQTRGVSICQSKEGLTQQIEFPVEVIVSPDPGCVMNRPADLKTYRFNISAKECVFKFMEKAAPNREHRLTTIGYSEVLVRGN